MLNPVVVAADAAERSTAPRPGLELGALALAERRRLAGYDARLWVAHSAQVGDWLAWTPAYSTDVHLGRVSAVLRDRQARPLPVIDGVAVDVWGLQLGRLWFLCAGDRVEVRSRGEWIPATVATVTGGRYSPTVTLAERNRRLAGEWTTAELRLRVPGDLAERRPCW
jgi:hypothetical protein